VLCYWIAKQRGLPKHLAADGPCEVSGCVCMFVCRCRVRDDWQKRKAAKHAQRSQSEADDYARLVDKGETGTIEIGSSVSKVSRARVRVRVTVRV
jgi:hypothetical protein